MRNTHSSQNSNQPDNSMRKTLNRVVYNTGKKKKQRVNMKIEIFFPLITPIKAKETEWNRNSHDFISSSNQMQKFFFYYFFYEKVSSDVCFFIDTVKYENSCEKFLIFFVP